MSRKVTYKRSRIEGNVQLNENGGLYQHGVAYSILTKLKVAHSICRQQRQSPKTNINISAVAAECGVSRAFVYKIINELQLEGEIQDPLLHPRRASEPVVCGNLTQEQELYLLSLRAEAPARSNKDYVRHLYWQYGVKISESSVSNFFLYRFSFSGKYRKANLVPLDKFKIENRINYFRFMRTVKWLRDHTKWKFFDEKHLVNKDTLDKKVCANPLTGQIDCIPVSGDFRESYNLIAAITCDKTNGSSMQYTMGKANGTAEAFMLFINRLLINGWLKHGDVLCLDNARIHSGGEASILEDYVWNYVRDESPMHIYVAWLPTRAPELNPIEFIFHILST